MSHILVSGTDTMPRGSAYHRNCLDEYRPPMSTRCSASNSHDMKHSKSDDLVMQNSAVPTSSSTSAKSKSDNNSVCVVNGGISQSASDSGFSASLALSAPVPVLLPKSECFSECDSENDVRYQMLDTSRIRGKDLQRKSSHHVGIYDRVDPEDSIRDMISDNDFYKFVLFKTHYDKYLHLSKKYEEARNIAYYLEEKYHEIK
ncbi:Chaperone protein DnaK, partial [Frankliniella fusca]